MGSKWPIMTIEECASSEPYSTQIGPFGKALMADEYVDSGVPVLRGVNVNNGRFHDDDFVFIDEETADRLSKFESFPGDVLLCHKGTLGQIGLMPNNRKYSRYIMGNSMLRVRCNTEVLLPQYLYYWLSSADGQHYLFSRVSQVGVPQIQTPLATLRQAELPIPPINEQRCIAHILGTLDDKIELNRRMNETLEAIARALFKSWFVDFDPVRAKAEGRDTGLPAHIADLFPDSFEDSELGKIPSGWEVRSLDEIAKFTNGLALQKYPPQGGKSLPVIKIAQLRAGNAEGADAAGADLDPDYIVDDGDVLFSWSGSLECVLWAGGEGALNQHLFKVTSDEFPKWLYYLWIHHHLDDFRFIAAGKATTMGHIQRHHLTDAKVVLPTKASVKIGTHVVGPMLDASWKLKVQSRTLTQLLDALLPKMISGEMRVRDAKRIATEAVV